MYYTECTEPQVEKLFDFKRITEQKWKQQQYTELRDASNYTNAYALAIMHNHEVYIGEWRLCIWIIDVEGWLLVFGLRYYNITLAGVMWRVNWRRRV